MGTDAPNPRVFKIRTVSVLLLLSALTLISYCPVIRNGFVTLDDTQYITYNPHVTPGLTWRGFRWAFQSGYACNWHPLTWLSHMLDCQLFGLNPLGHHLVSLALHIAVSLLVFQFLHQTTRAFWRSASVAAFFALHPLHVESVAWASERKDVLSAFFFLLTLIAYGAYARSKLELRNLMEIAAPVSDRRSSTNSFNDFRTGSTLHAPRSTLLYLLALALFALGLMSKPMVVTLPFVLLLLDIWPLQRIDLGYGELKRNARALIFEKVPFFLLSIGASIATYVAQKYGGAVANFHFNPLTSRIGNMFVSYARYLWKACWPSHLTAVYPYQLHWPASLLIVSVLLVLLASGLACLFVRRFPYAFVGWFWFVGMLVPVIGLVQVGREAMAERYMYLPSIGLFVAVVWIAHDLALAASRKLRGRGPEASFMTWFALPATATMALAPTVALCVVSTFGQVKTWRNGQTLFARAISLHPHDADSLSGYGAALAAAGRDREALPLLTEALRIDPTLTDAQLNLGTVLMNLGRPNEAVVPLESLVKRLPTRTDAHMNLGCAYFNVGRMAEAEASFGRAAALDPQDPQTRFNLSMALMRQSKFDQAISELSTAVRLNSSFVLSAAALSSQDAALHYYLGTVLLMQSYDTDGIRELLQAVRLNPDLPEAHRNLGLVFKKQGQFEKAIGHFSEVVRISPESIDARLSLAAALLDASRPMDAINQLNAALALAPNDPAVHCRLAAAQARNHESDQAIAHYREALRLSPGLPEAQHELAALLNH